MITVKTGKPDLPKTMILDIDGTLLKHFGKISDIWDHEPERLDGVLERIDEWCTRGFQIILFTGRPESMRALTVEQLRQLKISYDQLVVGVGIGSRILVNDLRPGDSTPTAAAVNIARNQGIADLEIV